MRVALIADEYVPARTSVAVQMQDLARALTSRGHRPTVIVPASLQEPWLVEDIEGVEVLRLRAPRTKDIGHIRRTLAELYMPYAMRRALSRSPFANTEWDGVAWYSPSIFFGPLIQWLKRRNQCSSYLILRDIFPEWAVDTGLMRRGLAYYFFKMIQRRQFDAADIIGVQTHGNLEHLRDWEASGQGRLEVLHNWLATVTQPVDFDSPALREHSDATILVYAGNMGVAQGMDCLIDLAAHFDPGKKVLFLFVGRGSEVSRLKQLVTARDLQNVMFHDEVSPEELPSLLDRCDVGLLTLDPRHTTHNVPGKFLTYLRAGLPVLARVNRGNDLVELIDSTGVGFASTAGGSNELVERAEKLIANAELRHEMGANGKALAQAKFSAESAAESIEQALGQLR